MDNTLCWIAGAFLAYLVIRGIRGMWTKVGCLLLVTQAAVTLEAATTSMRVYNNGSLGLTVAGYCKNNGDCTSPVDANWLGTTISPGTYATINTGNSHITSHPTLYASFEGTYNGVPFSYCPGFTWGNATDVYWNGSSWSGPPVNPTWYTNTISMKNTNWFDTKYTINIYSTNGTLMTNYNVTMMPDVKYDLNFSYTNDFTVTVTGPGDKSTDFEDRTVATTQGESAGTSATNPSNNNATGSRYDPFADLQANVPTTTNQMVADRQNAQGIVNSIDRGLQQLGNQLQSLGTIGGVGGATYLGQISTNTAAATNQMSDLGAIKTNTAVATNLLSDIKTNTGALEGGALAAASNLLGAAHNTLLNTASNAYFGEGSYGADLGAKAGGLTNQLANGWADVSNIDDSAGPLDISMSNGRKTYWLSLNPLSSKLADNPDGIWGRMSGGITKLASGMTWLKSKFIAIIFFILWWWMYKDIQQAIEKAAVPAGMIRPPSADWKGILGSLTFGLLLQTIITTTIMGIPTALAAYYDNMAGADAHLLPGAGLQDDLAAGSMGSNSSYALAALQVLALFIPFTTLFTAIGNYLAFILLKDRLLNWVFIALRVAGNTYGRCLAWGTLLAGLTVAPPAEATELHVANWTTNTVQLTNDIVMSFPPGQYALNLQPGTWTNTQGILDLPDSWRIAYVLSIAHAPDGTNLVFSVAGAETPVSAAVEGFGWGFMVFSTLWAVSLVRAGLRVGAGYAEV